MEELEAQGQWSEQDKAKHINILELQAVWNCLRKFLPRVRGQVVLVKSDNSTVVTYINKQGGTRSPPLCMLAWQMLVWCLEHNIVLKAVHLAGVNNRLADLLSRRRVLPTEWMLSRQVAQEIFNRVGRPLIDLFASAENAHLPTYCSWGRDPRAWAVDALSVSWRGMEAYAFPPISLVPLILNKVTADQ